MTKSRSHSRTSNSPEHIDVVVVGAGISGIGAARYLATELPAKSFVVLEARANLGGTWDLFHYPGIRSDSDLHTFGYEFKPWRHDHAIADGHLILDYLQETVQENDLARRMRFQHRVVGASWSTEEARWTLSVERPDPATGEIGTTTITASWIFAGTGYYRYDEGYAPVFEGVADFSGAIIHPQHWPEGYDYAGKRIVVIGSGATAVTLVPALLQGENRGAHVTMVQRTPTYILPLGRVDKVALALNRLLGPERGYAASRWKNIWLDRGIVKSFQAFPRAARALIRAADRRALPKGYPVDVHFKPPYDPWDQRLCLAADGDFFKVISDGDAEVVTGHIRRFTERGILLESGRELEADVIVTATGLNVRVLGGIDLVVDGEVMDTSKTVCYRGALLSGIPNLNLAIGYTTSSWTLKVSLVCRYVVSLLKHMDDNGYDIAVAVAPNGMETRPVMNLASGYAQRAADTTPRQGVEAPWRMEMSYPQDAKSFRGPLVDEYLNLSTRRQSDRSVDAADSAVAS
ncbi:flavin-containing monooxygenase [Streptomyces sp. 2A115]|uniref:flavin-containing monooxygenase n=1 Tax=Streptomyces sp. 2A115 TaxID=3457439 RepID=UPI003FD0CD3B